MPTASRDLVVSNKLGLHARPAMQFVDLANQFQSKVTVFKGGEEPAASVLHRPHLQAVFNLVLYVLYTQKHLLSLCFVLYCCFC